MRRSFEQAPEELADFYAGSYSRLVGALTLIGGNRHDAEEAVQEAFTRLVSRWARISRYDDPQAWVRRVALNLLISRRRRLVRDASMLPRLFLRNPEMGSDQTLVDPGVMTMLAHLPAGHREVFVLHYLLDQSVEEIATDLEIPTGTVKSRLFRSRNILTRYVKELNHDGLS